MVQRRELRDLSMPRKRSPLPGQVLLFLLGTLLAVVIDNLTSLKFLWRQALPLAGVTVLLIGVMVWQHRTEQRLALPARPAWHADRSPFPGLEAFTEQDSAMSFGRDTEITELLDRLHPVVTAQVNRLFAMVGPSGAGKSSGAWESWNLGAQGIVTWGFVDCR